MIQMESKYQKEKYIDEMLFKYVPNIFLLL